MTWKLYAVLSGGAFVATYLFSGPSAMRPVQVEPVTVRKAPVRQVSTAEIEIEELANRLEARVHSDATYRPPTRNPFEFGARHVEPKQVIAPKPVDIPPAPIALPPPPIRLSGVATDHVDGTLHLTAIVSTPNGVVLLREGDTVVGYRVVTITETSVTLASAADNSPLTLTLSRR
jgi:hypothetical protein